MQGKTLAEVEQISNKFMQEFWSAESGITSVGSGKDDDGNYCISVLVLDQSKKDNIPTEYDGVTVIVAVTEPIVPL